MRTTSALLAWLALFASTTLATAAPAVPAMVTPQVSEIIPVAGGCGRGFHRYHGVCVANYHYLDHALEAGIEPGGRPYYPGYYGSYRRRPYSNPGDGYGPLNHATPGDYGAANQLNAQEAGRGYWGYWR